MKNLNSFNKLVLHYLENLVLVVITIATVIACGAEIKLMIENRGVHLADLLLLFLYLEVLAMVGHYYESRKIPVRYPLYIGIMALARYLTLDMKAMSDWRIIAVSVAIGVLALTVLIIRYGHFKFPYPDFLNRSKSKDETELTLDSVKKPN